MVFMLSETYNRSEKVLSQYLSLPFEVRKKNLRVHSSLSLCIFRKPTRVNPKLMLAMSFSFADAERSFEFRKDKD